MTIEVDGALNAVSVYDLQLILDTTARRGTQQVDLDLTRVTHIDDDGLRGLLRFCQAAIANGTILRFSGASRAAREAMRGQGLETRWGDGLRVGRVRKTACFADAKKTGVAHGCLFSSVVPITSQRFVASTRWTRNG